MDAYRAYDLSRECPECGSIWTDYVGPGLQSCKQMARKMTEFTEEERVWLQAIVVDWINDGFTTPPYEDDIYSIFEKLDIHNDIPFPLQYDVARPETQSLRKNARK